VLASPFRIAPGDCLLIRGLDHGSGPGVNRQFPQGGWYVEALQVDDAASHQVRPRAASQDDDGNQGSND
jgi:hypothetical protein